MRAVVQTVSRARVTVDGDEVGSVTDGLLVLLGVTHTDTRQTAATMARKVHELRILDDERSAAERGAPVATGRFGAHMLVESVNVGPRTVWLEL